MMDISEIVKGVYFKGFPAIGWDKVFKREAISLECGVRKNIFYELCSILAKPFVDKIRKVEFRTAQSPKILFFQSIDRKSCQQQFFNVAELSKHAEILTCNGNRVLSFHVFRGFKMLGLLWSWVSCISRLAISFSQKVNMLSILLFLYNFQKHIFFLDFQKYNLFVSFYDSTLFDAYLTEVFKFYGVPTATLQHGAFSAWRENEMIHSGVELRSFHSDYFLCWNRFTFDEAIKSGIPESDIAIVGIIGYVGERWRKCLVPRNKIFGVVLGHPSFHEENLALIRAANILAKSIGYKYYLKLHPNYAEDAFSAYVDKRFYLGNKPKGISMLEYADSVEFSIVGSSSVFIELVYIQHDVIRYSDNSVHDKFRDIHSGKLFSKVEDIVDVYLKNAGKDYSKELFEVLCTVQDVDGAYKNFFAKFEQ